MIKDYNKYIHIQPDGTTITLQVEKEFSLNNTDDFKIELTKALNSFNNIHIKLTDIEVMDISAAQLLHAFYAEAKIKNKIITYEVSCSEGVKKLLLYAGLTKFTENITL